LFNAAEREALAVAPPVRVRVLLSVLVVVAVLVLVVVLLSVALIVRVRVLLSVLMVLVLESAPVPDPASCWASTEPLNPKASAMAEARSVFFMNPPKVEQSLVLTCVAANHGPMCNFGATKLLLVSYAVFSIGEACRSMPWRWLLPRVSMRRASHFSARSVTGT
jgi:hypothetical protein